MRLQRLFILLITFGMLVSAGFAGNDNNETINIQGIVLDEAGEPLAGVAIRIQGYPSTIYTDLDGVFTVQLPRSGKLNATVSTISYKEKQVELDAQTAAGGQSVKISLEPNGGL